jgi:hypothetical protein
MTSERDSCLHDPAMRDPKLQRVRGTGVATGSLLMALTAGFLIVAGIVYMLTDRTTTTATAPTRPPMTDTNTGSATRGAPPAAQPAPSQGQASDSAR